MRRKIKKNKLKKERNKRKKTYHIYRQINVDDTNALMVLMNEYALK